MSELRRLKGGWSADFAGAAMRALPVNSETVRALADMSADLLKIIDASGVSLES